MESLDYITKKLLYKNNIFIDIEKFILHLHSNASFPSVKAISDTLDYFGIKNLVANVPKDALSQLPEYFFAILNNNGNDEIVLVTRSGKYVYVQAGQKRQKIDADTFLVIWTGTIIAVEAETKKKFTYLNESFLYGILFVIFLICLQLVQFSWINLTITILSGTGILVSVLINQQEAGINNPIAEKVCNRINNTGGCDTIINSKDNKIFSFVSLSNLGAVYFVSTLLIANLLGIDHLFFIVFSSLGIPFILYSLYSQAFRLKQWCVLCVCISAIFILEYILICYANRLQQTLITTDYILSAMIIILISYIGTDFYKKYIYKSAIHKKIQIENYRIKRDIKLFDTLLKEFPLTNDKILHEESRISYGAKFPLIEITAVTNPLCGFCSESFNVYYKLLKKYADTIKINFIFYIPYEFPDHSSTKISTTLVNLYFSDRAASLNAFYEWMRDRKVDKWTQKYKLSEDQINKRVDRIFADHRKWCEINNINHTPVTFIDGHFYPNQYEIADLLFIIEDILQERTKLSVAEVVL